MTEERCLKITCDIDGCNNFEYFDSFKNLKRSAWRFCTSSDSYDYTKDHVCFNCQLDEE